MRLQVNKEEGQPYHTLMRGTEAVAVAAPVTVTLLNLVSLFILFYKTLRHTGTGFAYGFLNASYLHQGLAVILSCYVMHADRDFLNELEGHSTPPVPLPSAAAYLAAQLRLCQLWALTSVPLMQPSFGPMWTQSSTSSPSTWATWLLDS